MYRVLVVDDEKLEREGIRFLLSMEEGEWEIYEAANGKLALNELRSHKIDLMISKCRIWMGWSFPKKQEKSIRGWRSSFSVDMEIFRLHRKRYVMV